MGQFVGHDSDGIQHVVWFQERSMSCGPACVFMVECNQRRQSVIGGEARIRDIAALFPNGYVEGQGTFTPALAATLVKIGITARYMQVSNIGNHLADGNFPLIVHIGWAGGGGHFTVAERQTSRGDIVFLDPYYGLNEIPLSSFPSYTISSYVLLSGVLATGSLSGHIVDVN